MLSFTSRALRHVSRRAFCLALSTSKSGVLFLPAKFLSEDEGLLCLYWEQVFLKGAVPTRLWWRMWTAVWDCHMPLTCALSLDPECEPHVCHGPFQ